MPPVAETDDPGGPARTSDRTRADRMRRERLTAGVLRPPSDLAHPLVAGATVAGAGLLALTAVASRGALAAAVGLTGVVLAWGWPRLLGSPSRVGSSSVLTVSALATVAAVLAAGEEPWLEHVPVAVAVSVLAMFLHQLLRRDGRPRLTQSLAVTAGGVAVITCGAGYVAVPDLPDGSAPVLVAAAAAALAAPVDLLVPLRSLRRWMLPAAMLAGALAGLVVALVGDGTAPAAGSAAALGLAVAALGHVTRRVLAVLPPIESRRGQLAAAAAALLVAGILVDVAGQLLLG